MFFNNFIDKCKCGFPADLMVQPSILFVYILMLLTWLYVILFGALNTVMAYSMLALSYYICVNRGSLSVAFMVPKWESN